MNEIALMSFARSAPPGQVKLIGQYSTGIQKQNNTFVIRSIYIYFFILLWFGRQKLQNGGFPFQLILHITARTMTTRFLYNGHSNIYKPSE